ncbi:MAG: MATE family efflux transporter, partial [Limnohabitans sp.]
MNTPGRRGAAPPAAPRLGPLAGPLLAELVLGMAVGLVGTALAASQSDTHAAAFALVQQVVATLFVLFRILGAGVSVVVAQELGAGRGAQAVQVARSVLGASSWMGLLAAMLTALTAPLLLAVFQAPADVRALALPLLWWMAPIL